MLSIKNLTKRYGNKVAVDNLSLEVLPGRIVGFIGHNGAGKTTTIKSLAGIIAFDEGEITIGGKNIKTDPVAAKSITAYIPDNPDLYEFMKAIQYLNFIADIYGVSKEKRETLTKKYASLFQIEGELGNPISSFSHGMKQKLALISALIREPKLLVLDEPFVGLDPIASHQLKLELRRICDEGGAVFFSTHVLEVAQKLCDEIAIIKEGKLISFGKTSDVIGDSNLETVFLELEQGSDA
ncbi:ABC transporter ATP-binding protein [Guggenheimella bovis]